MHGQRGENQKARKGNKFVWLAGTPSLLSTTEELPAKVTMKHSTASQDLTQTAFSSGSRSIFNRPSQDRLFALSCFHFIVNVIVTFTEKKTFYIT